MSNHQPLVSVIIPAYNSEKTIYETLDCVKNQSYKNIEVIVCDDGSTDKTEAIIKNFQGLDIVYIKSEKCNASIARNKAIEASKGSILQLLDADDLLSINKIASQVALITGKENALSICNCKSFTDRLDDNTKNIFDIDNWPSTAFQFLMELYKQEKMIAIHSLLFHKKLLEKSGLFHKGLTIDDDGEFNCRLLLACNEILFSKEIAYYRKHAFSLSTKKGFAAAESALDACTLKIQYLLEYGCNNYEEKVFGKMLASTMYHYLSPFPTLLKKANEFAKMHSIDLIPTGGKNFKKIANVIGINNALKAKRLLS